MLIHQDEVDGVPLFWAEAPGPFVAGLLFRVGRVDERLYTSGITHLVEHLAIPAWAPKPGLEWNGWVSLTSTCFWASGEPADVAAFLSEVTRQLHDLPLGRLETEKGILRAEEASVGRGMAAAIAGIRFGAVGIALIDFRELGLRTLDAETVARWAQERFTTGNAALCMSGPPPPELELHLPPGPRHPPPRYEPPPDNLPAYSHWGSGGVALSLFAPRSYALGLAWQAAEQRAIRRLRYERGLIYSLSATNTPPNREDANIVFIAECVDANVDAVCAGLLEVLEEIATDGPSDEEHDQWLGAMERAARDPNEAVSVVATFAEDLLLDDFRTNEQALAGARAVTARDAATAIRTALLSAILLIPEEGAAAPPPPFNLFESAEPAVRINGRRFPPKGLKGRLGRQGYAIVGDDGAAWQSPDGTRVDIAFHDCEALMTWADGTMSLINAHGGWFSLETGLIRNGDEASEAILRAIPSERVVPMD